MATPLTVESFGRRYRRDRPWAVRNVSFSLPEGAVAALVGPNGSGKSTLIRACLGFETPDAGRISIFGVDPQVDRDAAIREVSYIPQSSFLYRGLTIRDHFTLASTARPAFDRNLATRHIEAAGLSDTRKPKELSGGEQAQVALAIALGTRAPLMLLDEPLASLDPLARRDFVATLSGDVRSRRATVVISSHVIGDVEHLCDWLVVLAAGNLVLASSIEDAKRRFNVAPVDESNKDAVVGSFTGPRGEDFALVEDAEVGRQATLEEIVLGHMAASRTRPRSSRQ